MTNKPAPITNEGYVALKRTMTQTMFNDLVPKYEGDKNDKGLMHGNGKLSYSDGTIYEG